MTNDSTQYLQTWAGSLQPKHIGLFDDVITAGSHFRAAKDLLQDRFPEAKIVGIFVARRVPLF